MQKLNPVPPVLFLHQVLVVPETKLKEREKINKESIAYNTSVELAGRKNPRREVLEII